MSETSELDGSSLAVDSRADDHNIFGVLNGSDNSSSKLDLLPGFFNIDVVSTVGALVRDVSLHLVVEVKGTSVAVGSQKSLDIVLLSS